MTNTKIDAGKPTAGKSPRKHSKANQMLTMLQNAKGASLEAMTSRTGWQPHTVRAAMTGLRKRGHIIDKRKDKDTTVWFIPKGVDQ